MRESEAVRVTTALGAYFGRDLPEDQLALWARELTPYGIEDGLEAARLLGSASRFMPSLREFIDAIREVRSDRLRANQRALPTGTGIFVSFEEWLINYATDEQRRTVARVFPGVAERYGVREEDLG